MGDVLFSPIYHQQNSTGAWRTPRYSFALGSFATREIDEVVPERALPSSLELIDEPMPGVNIGREWTNQSDLGSWIQQDVLNTDLRCFDPMLIQPKRPCHCWHRKTTFLLIWVPSSVVVIDVRILVGAAIQLTRICWVKTGRWYQQDQFFVAYPSREMI